jgi:hypothetical protein
MSLGPGRRIKLEEWVRHLCTMASAKNHGLGVVETQDSEDQAGEEHPGHDDMDEEGSQEVERFVLTCLYDGCSYETPTTAREEQALEWIKMPATCRFSFTSRATTPWTRRGRPSSSRLPTRPGGGDD